MNVSFAFVFPPAKNDENAIAFSFYLYTKLSKMQLFCWDLCQTHFFTAVQVKCACTVEPGTSLASIEVWKIILTNESQAT